jgi:hypothetical protein
VQEPGLDKDEWESEWSDLTERLRDDPGNALFELDDLVARMLSRAACHFANARARRRRSPSSSANSRKRVGSRAVGAGGDVDPGDIAHALNCYRELYESLLDRGPA